MRTKLWSTLLALVLLCACVAGVLLLGVQAEGTNYDWYVDGVGTETDCFASIDKAMAQAYKTDWDSGDTLTIHITADGTAAATGGNQLFGVKPIFRAVGDFLPITIEGGANKYGFDLPAGSSSSYANVACTNNYTFKNMNLPWSDNYVNFAAGCAQVCFDTVTFTSSSSTYNKIKFGADCSSRATWRGFGADNFEAMATVGPDGVKTVTTSLTFKNTTYNGANWLVGTRVFNGGFDTSLDSEANNLGLKITNQNVNCELILDSGAKVARVKMFQGSVTESNAFHDSIFTLKKGSEIKGFYGSYGMKVNGNITVNLDGTNTNAAICMARYDTTDNTEANINGTLTVNLGENYANSYTSQGTAFDLIQNSTNYRGTILDGDVVINLNGYNLAQPISLANFGTVKSDVTVNINSGTIDTYAVLAGATVQGTLTNNVNGGTITTFYGTDSSSSSTLAYGNVVNNFNGGTVTTVYGGGASSSASANTITNTLGGTKITYFYGGGLKNNIPGKLTTNENEAYQTASVLNIAKTNSTTATYFYGGTKEAGTIAGDIINVFEGGSHASVYAGSRLGASTVGGNIVTTFYAGTIHTFNGAASSSKVSGGIYNNIPSGSTVKVTNAFYGGHYNGTANYVENNVLSADAEIALFYGGNNDGGTSKNVVNNVAAGTFNIFYGGNKKGSNSGTISNNISGGTFSDYVYGGSNNGTVTKIVNNVSGGTFNGSYYICGNNKATFATASGDTVDTVRIANDIKGGTFKRIVGGSYNADVNGSIKSTYDTAIVATTAIYAGNASGGDIAGSINNTVNGTVTDKKATIRVFYGGNNNGVGTIGGIVNTVNGGQLRAFYGGCNYEGTPASITNTVNGGVFGCEFFQDLEEDEAIYFAGGNRVADLTCDVTTTLKSGTFVNVYAGTLLGNDSGNAKLILAPQGDLTVLGKAFGITGVTSDANAPIFIGKDSYLSVTASDPSNTVYVCQTQGWDADRYVIVSGTENSINWKNADGVTGTPAVKTVGGDTVLYCGTAASVDSVSLILTDRISVKAYFAKDRVGDNFSYSFTGLLGDVLVSGTKADLTAEGEYYYVVLPAIGLAEFEKPFLLCGNGLETCQMSIVELADLGAAYYETKDAKSANLFQSIADLGRSANAGETRYNMTPETVTYTPAEATVKAGTDVLDVQSMTLVMSNAVGISFKGQASASDTVIDVFVNGKKVTELCTVTVAEEKNANEKYDVSVDLYLNVASMSKELKIQLKSSDESTTYLAMYTRADAIAQTIANNLADKKALAEDLLVYIQAVDAYKA